MKLIFLLLILLILAIPQILAWDWENHKAIVDKLYYSIPYETQVKLDLEQLEIGSIAPDKDFHDNRLHHYPPSYNKTLFWLNQTKYYLSIGDYNNASYSFGVVTHYISDSFVAPHYVSGEEPKLHTKFEHQASTIKTKCKKRSYDLDEELKEATLNEKDWGIWLKNQTNILPQKELEQAIEFIFPIFLETFSTTCEERTTKINQEKFNLGKKTKTYLLLLAIFFVGNLRIKKLNFFKH